MLVNFSASGVKSLFFLRLANFLFFVFLFVFLRRVDLRSMLPPVVFGVSLVLFAYGVVQKFVLFPIYLNRLAASGNGSFYSQAMLTRVASGRIFSLFVLPTLYALVCGVLLVFILHYFLAAGKWVRLAWAPLLLLGALNLLLTQSFGGIVCTFLAVLFYLFYSRVVKLKYLAPLIMTLSLVFFLVVALRFGEAKKLEPLKLRLANWTQAARMCASAPLFGVGLGNYESEISLHERPGEPSSIYAHNFVLQWTAETGFPFLMLLMALAALSLRKYRGIFLVRPNLVFTAVILLVAAYNLVDIGIYFIPAGIALSVSLSQVFPSERRISAMTVAPLAFLSVLLLLNQAAENAGKSADDWASRQDYARAESEYRRSLKWNPFSVRPVMGLAVIRDMAGKSGEAKGLLEKYLSRVPRFGYANFLLSKIYYREGACLSALFHAETAVKANRRESRYRKWHESIKTELQNQLVRPGN